MGNWDKKQKGGRRGTEFFDGSLRCLVGTTQRVRGENVKRGDLDGE